MKKIHARQLILKNIHAFARLKNAKKIACYTGYIFNRAGFRRLGGTPLPFDYKGRCLAWDVSPVAPTPFGFFLHFCCCCCCCCFVCVCVFCIINLYCISQEEHLIKL